MIRKLGTTKIQTSISEPIIKFSSGTKQMRERVAEEAVPKSAQVSQVKDGDEAKFAIDLDLNTEATAEKGSDGGIWLKVSLDQVYCVERIIEYNKGLPKTNQFEWTCSSTDCSACESERQTCNKMNLTVETENHSQDLPTRSDCRYGNVVKLQHISHGARTLTIAEIAIFGKKGNLKVLII
jgi:hypothetical protein